MTLESGDRSRVAAMVKHIFHMKDPWPSAMKIMKLFSNPVWAAWNLILLNERIINPGDLKQLKTINDKWAYLQWLKANPQYVFMSQHYDSTKRADDYYKQVIPADQQYKGGMERLNIVKNLRDLANKIEAEK